MSRITRIGLAAAAAAALLAPATASTSDSAKVVATKATTTLDRGTFGARARALSAKRLQAKMVLTVAVRRTTRVSFHVTPCRRTSGRLTCNSAKERRSPAVQLQTGHNRILRRIEVSRTTGVRCLRADVRERRAGTVRTILRSSRGVALCAPTR